MRKKSRKVVANRPLPRGWEEEADHLGSNRACKARWRGGALSRVSTLDKQRSCALSSAFGLLFCLAPQTGQGRPRMEFFLFFKPF
jgi:hypothetical protein